jgi:hypothetical protein
MSFCYLQGTTVAMRQWPAAHQARHELLQHQHRRAALAAPAAWRRGSCSSGFRQLLCQVAQQVAALGLQQRAAQQAQQHVRSVAC